MTSARDLTSPSPPSAHLQNENKHIAPTSLLCVSHSRGDAWNVTRAQQGLAVAVAVAAAAAAAAGDPTPAFLPV